MGTDYTPCLMAGIKWGDYFKWKQAEESFERHDVRTGRPTGEFERTWKYWWEVNDVRVVVDKWDESLPEIEPLLEQCGLEYRGDAYNRVLGLTLVEGEYLDIRVRQVFEVDPALIAPGTPRWLEAQLRLEKFFNILLGAEAPHVHMRLYCVMDISR